MPAFSARTLLFAALAVVGGTFLVMVVVVYTAVTMLRSARRQDA